jgi:peptide/nickel transport system substrate-binding protein
MDVAIRWRRRLPRRACVATAVAVLLTVAAAGCGGSSGSSGGGTLRIGDANSQIDSLNPFAAQNVFAFASFRAMYPFLLQYDADQQVIDEFAESHSVSGDNLVYTFKTFADAKWSDGKPLTADDAAWTLNTIIKFKSGPAVRLAPFVDGIASVEATSPTELVVTYDKVMGTALNNLAEIPILPRHVWEPMATGAGKDLLTYANTTPVTGGPFTLSGYKKNEFILFDKSESYYRDGAKLDGFGFQFFTSPDALVNAVKSGDVDVALKVPPTAAESLKSDSSLEIVQTGGMDVALLGINSLAPAHAELRKPEVRQAIDLAIDRDAIVEIVGNGTGTPNRSILPIALKQWFDPSLEHADHDLDEANRLLDSLGYERGADGLRVADGRPMSYDLYTWTTATGMPRILELVTRDLKQLGIEVKGHVSDFPAFAEAIFGEGNSYADWDLNLSDWGALYDPSTQLALATCDQYGSTNETGYCNEEYDALYAKQGTQTGAEREATVKQMQQMIAEDRPLLPLWTPATTNAVRKGVEISLSSPFLVEYESQRWLTEASR